MSSRQIGCPGQEDAIALRDRALTFDGREPRVERVETLEHLHLEPLNGHLGLEAFETLFGRSLSGGTAAGIASPLIMRDFSFH